MKTIRTTLAATLLCGAAIALASCGGAENRESVPDNQSIETRDTDSDSLDDNTNGNTNETSTTGGTTN